MGRIGIDELKYIFTLQECVKELNLFKFIQPETLERLHKESKEARQILGIKTKLRR